METGAGKDDYFCYLGKTKQKKLHGLRPGIKGRGIREHQGSPAESAIVCVEEASIFLSDSGETVRCSQVACRVEPKVAEKGTTLGVRHQRWIK